MRKGEARAVGRQLDGPFYLSKVEQGTRNETDPRQTGRASSQTIRMANFWLLPHHADKRQSPFCAFLPPVRALPADRSGKLKFTQS